MTAHTPIACMIMLTMLAGCGKTREDREKRFKESFRKSFVKSCTESAMKKGLKERDAESRCDCVAGFLTDRYSSVELKKLTDVESPETRRIITEAVNACK